MASANLTWATGDQSTQSAYTSTAHASFVSHTGEPTRRTAATEYEHNKAKNRHPSDWAATGERAPLTSSYKSTFATSSSTYAKIPPISAPAATAGRAGGSPREPVGAATASIPPRAPGFDILTGTAVTAQRAPGTFFAGRVSMQKLEAKAHARQPGWNIITGSFGG